MKHSLLWFAVGCIVICIAGMVLVPVARAEEKENHDKFTENVPPELQKQIDQAIAKGVEYLQSEQLPDGSWVLARVQIAGTGQFIDFPVGHTALCVYTLIQCGVSPFDKDIERAFDWMRQQELGKTYEVALIIMSLVAKWDHEDPAADGGTKVKSKKPCDKMTDEDRKWLERCFNFLVEKRISGQGWRYPDESGVDHSNTQFGVLGLAAAARCGLYPQPKVWQEILDHFLTAQEAKGPAVVNKVYNEKRKKDGTTAAPLDEKSEARGWGYFKNQGPVYGSMSAVGVACVVIARDQLVKMKAIDKATYDKANAAARDGIAWLGQNFSLTENPKYNGWHYYYLYGLERAGVLADRVYMKDHEWYLEGSEYLVGQQAGNGAWREQQPLQDTSFALLFLKMASKHLAVVTTGGK